MALQLLVQLPDEALLRRLLDAPTSQEVAREPGVFLFVIKDGDVRPVLAGDPA
jgi:hypothetical protein